MSRVDVISARSKNSGMVRVKIENEPCVSDVSQWTVVNDVSYLPHRKNMQWTEDKSDVIGQLRSIKRELDVNTSNNSLGEVLAWPTVKTEPQSPGKPESAQQESIETTSTGTALVSDVKQENCGYTLMGEIHEIHGVTPINNVKTEQTPVIIKQEPDDSLDKDIQGQDHCSLHSAETMTGIESGGVITGIKESVGIIIEIKEENRESDDTDSVNTVDYSVLSSSGCDTANKDSPEETSHPPQSTGAKDRKRKRKNSGSPHNKTTSAKRRKKDNKYIEKTKDNVNNPSRRMRCWLCKDLLESKILLNEHLSICHKKFAKEKQSSSAGGKIGSKINIHHDKGKAPSNMEKVSEYQGNDSTSITYECSKCDRTFVSKGNFIQHKEWHLRSGHGEITMTILDPVSQTRRKPKESERLNRKKSENTENKQSKRSKSDVKKCPVCNKTVCKKSFARHMKVHSIDPKDHPFACSQCDKRYIERRDMEAHFARHHPDVRADKEKKDRRGHFPCTECSKVYTTSTNLKLHHQGVHLKHFTCSMCACTFYNTFNLERHVKSCQKRLHGDTAARTGDSVKCEDCKKTFTNKYCLVKHMARFHSTETPYQCEFCLKHFKTKSNCSSHVKRIHCTGSKMSVQCPKCPRQVSSQAELHIHQSVFRYVCEICPQHFSRPEDLKQHADKHTDT